MRTLMDIAKQSMGSTTTSAPGALAGIYNSSSVSSIRYGVVQSVSGEVVSILLEDTGELVTTRTSTPVDVGNRVALIKNGQNVIVYATEEIMNQINNKISRVDVEYALSTSSTTAPSAGWSTTAPSDIPDGQYLWTRTVTYTQGGTSSTSDPVCITTDAAQGKTLEDITEQYYLSTSRYTQSGGSWQDACPEWQENRYIWTRSKLAWSDGSKTYTTPVLATALNQANEKAEVSTWYTFADEEGTHVVSTPNDATTGPNVLLNGYNLIFRDGTEELASFSPEEFEMLGFFIKAMNDGQSISIGGNNLVIGSKPPTTAGWDMESVGVKELVQRCAAMHVEVFGNIASTATNTWAEGVFYTGNNNVVTFNTGTVMNVDSRRRIYIQQTGVYKVSLYGAVYSCSDGDLCHFGLGTDADHILVDAQQNMNGNWGTIAKTALMRVTEPDIYLKPFYKCEQGYGSKLATNTSSVTIEYLGVG